MTMVPLNVSAIDRYLQALWERGGTDLHLTAGAPPLVRVDGRMLPLDEPELSGEDCAQLILSVLNEDLSSQLRREKEVDFSFSWHDQTRFRANCYFQQGTMAMALRAIPFRIPSFEELGLPPVIEYFANLPQGLVLVTGPTGSGKSTTQASVIDFINEHRECHILTIEDPIEYVHRHKRSAVNQREVGFDTDSFERALRSALREDPDVILVGEMRDPETIQFALTIAETGHLVFATLHTNDASTALDRIVDVFPSERQQQIRVQLAASIAGVVSQRLIPRVGGGLVAGFEVIVANNPIRALIRDGKTHQIRNVVSTSIREGMQTMEVALNSLVEQGLISYEDALDRSLYPKEIRDPAGATAYAAAVPGR
jgi:twitching motility protein PilT